MDRYLFKRYCTTTRSSLLVKTVSVFTMGASIYLKMLTTHVSNVQSHSSQKSPEHQNGTIHATTHRLFYIDVQRMVSNSFQMDLSLIVQTEYYAGLFKSSPKVTCHLTGTPAASDPREQDAGFESWECEVCAYRNPPGLSPAAARICSLCGVPRTAVSIPTTSVLSQHLSTSLPSSALSSSTSLAATHSSGAEQSSIACPACTFLNYPSLLSCEMCSTDLPRPKHEFTKSAPSSRSITPGFDDINESSKKMIKISFRKGGDKPFYAVLKRSLKSKAWEVRKPIPRNKKINGHLCYIRKAELDQL